MADVGIQDTASDMDAIRAQVAASQARAPTDTASEMDAIRSQTKGASAVEAAPKAPTDKYAHAPTPLRRMSANPFEIVPAVAAQTVTGGGAAIMGGLHGAADVYSRLASGEPLASAREQGGATAAKYIEEHTYQPEGAASQAASNIVNAPGAVLGKVADYAGQKTADVTGSAAAGANVKTAIEVLPGVALSKIAGKVQARNLAAAEAARPPLVGPGSVPTAAPVPVQAPTSAAGAAAPAAEVLAPSATPRAPIAPEITIPRENPPMPETAPTSAEIQARTDALKKVGIENIRQSAVVNNPKEASSQYITSKASQEPYGAGMTEQINHEKGALENHFGNVENAAGGEVVRYGTPEQVQDQIHTGQTIKAGLQAGYDAHEAKTHELYTQADEANGGKPVNLPTLNDYIGKQENFVYEPENALRNGVKGYLSRSGLLDADGTVKPMTVAQSEGVRQYINSKFNPETKTVSKDMKNAIDNDVFSQVGGATYQEARAHFAKGMETYENPKAMGNLLGDKGVNQKIPDEMVLPKVAALPESQFSHVVETLRNDGQQAAINQIQTSLVNQVHRAGQSAVNEPWNSIAAANEAAKLSNKLKIAFADKPELLQKVYDGINAGNIVHIPTKYPGAAVQTNLLKNKFSELAIQRAATGAGGLVGGIFGPAGAAGGAMLGEHLGAKGANAARLGRQQKQLGKEIIYNEGTSGLPR